MKKKLIAMAAACFAVVPLFADTETVDGYTWTDCIGGGKAGNLV